MIFGSDGLERVLAGSHAPVVKVEACNHDGGRLGDLVATAGSLTIDRSTLVRRSCSFTFLDTPDSRELLYRPGTQIRAYVGAMVGGSPQTLPVHWGGIAPRSRKWGEGTITLTSPDLMQLLVKDLFEAPRQSNKGFTVAQMVQTLCMESLPGLIGWEDQSGDGTVCAPVTWESSRTDAVAKLVDSIGCELFLRPDGVLVLRRVRDASQVPDWSLSSGVNLTAAAVEQSSDSAFNVVVVTSDRSDTAAIRAVARDWDVNSVTSIPNTGRNVDPVTSSLVTTKAQAQLMANVRLLQRRGSRQSLTYEGIRHPGVEAGDLHEVLIEGERHLTVPDSLSFDLFGSGSMSGSGREVTLLPDVQEEAS